ncbi:MAG: hypothetical protein WCK58_09085 [Chloroflexota bacterium]
MDEVELAGRRLPFTPESLRCEDGSLVAEGAVDARPATIRVGAEDVPDIVRLVPRHLLAGPVAVVGFVILRHLLRR